MFSSFNKVYIPIPSTKHDIKIQIHGLTLNKHQKQILFTESYLTLAQCIQRWIMIRKKVSTECIMCKNAINISKPHLKGKMPEKLTLLIKLFETMLSYG